MYSNLAKSKPSPSYFCNVLINPHLQNFVNYYNFIDLCLYTHVSKIGDLLLCHKKRRKEFKSSVLDATTQQNRDKKHDTDTVQKEKENKTVIMNQET